MPISIPEINTLISSHLNINDLLNCILVSKSWHHAFLSPIWENTVIDSGFLNQKDKIIASPENITLHREFIRALTIQHSSIRPYALHYSKLHTLTLKGPLGNTTQDKEMAQLISQNLSLTELNISMVNDHLSPELWNAISQLQHLNSLGLGSLKHEFSKDDTERLWDICQHLEKLRLYSISFPESTFIHPRFTFPKLKSIELKLKPNAPTELDFMGRCENLEELLLRQEPQDDWLDFLLGPKGDWMDFLLRSLEKNTWPSLHSLRLGNGISDYDLSSIIQRQNIHRLEIWQSDFNKLSLQSLEPYFGTLVELRLWGCKDVDGAIVQEITKNCRHLEIFAGVSTLASKVSWLDWVCLSIRHLELYIKFEVSHGLWWRSSVLKCFGKLTRLRYLSIGNEQKYSFREGLDLRLEKGLNELKDLKDLEHVDLGQTTQSLSEKEVEWMLENWKSLRSIGGELCQYHIFRDELEQMFAKAGVKVIK